VHRRAAVGLACVDVGTGGQQRRSAATSPGVRGGVQAGPKRATSSARGGTWATGQAAASASGQRHAAIQLAARRFT
jgi:hypothetical protein